MILCQNVPPREIRAPPPSGSIRDEHHLLRDQTTERDGVEVVIPNGALLDVHVHRDRLAVLVDDLHMARLGGEWLGRVQNDIDIWRPVEYCNKSTHITGMRTDAVGGDRERHTFRLGMMISPPLT